CWSPLLPQLPTCERTSLFDAKCQEPPIATKRLRGLRLKARNAAPTVIGYQSCSGRSPMRRREFITGLGVVAAWPMVGRAQPRATPPTSDTRLILLGTKGGPRVSKGRANPSNLVIAGGRSYVVDCGYGVTRQLVGAGVEAHEVRTILITH